MTKQELIKKYNEIVLKTNGSREDFVAALFQILAAIRELDEPKMEECVPVDIELENGVSYWGCSSCKEPIHGGYKHCPCCGRKIKKGEEDAKD